jgi:hypothetical protein
LPYLKRYYGNGFSSLKKYHFSTLQLLLKVCSSSTSKTQKLKKKKEKTLVGGPFASNIRYLSHTLCLLLDSIWQHGAKFWSYDRVFSKVRKTRHQNPEFGPEFGSKPGEIQKKPAKKYITLQGRDGSNSEMHHCFFFGAKLSFILFLTPSFLFPEHLPLLLHIFSLFLPVQLLEWPRTLVASTAATYIFTAPTSTVQLLEWPRTLVASTAVTYIFTIPTSTTTIITLEPCALKCWVSVFHTQI